MEKALVIKAGCRLFTAVATAASSLLLAALILYSGVSLAELAKKTGKEAFAVQVLQQGEVALSHAENKQKQQQTRELVKQYAFGFVDAAIQFESLPYSNPKLLLALAKTMPKEVTVTGVTFHAESLRVFCQAEKEASLRLFLQNLQQQEIVKEASCRSLTQKQAIWCAEVACTPKMKPGSLLLPGGRPETQAQSSSKAK